MILLWVGFAFQSRREPGFLMGVLSTAFWGGLGFSCGAGLFLVRNVKFAHGNPLFPIPQFGFPKESDWPTFWNFIAAFSREKMQWDFATNADKLQQIFRDHVVITASAVLLLWIAIRWILSSSVRDRMAGTIQLEGRIQGSVLLIVCAAIGFVLFLLKSGPRSDLRLFGPGVFLFVAALSGLAVQAHAAISSRTLAFWIVSLLTLADSHMLTQRPLEWLKSLNGGPEVAAPSSNLLRHTNGHLKKWVRQNIPLGSRLLTTGDNEFYYFAVYDASSIPDDPTWDSFFAGGKGSDPIEKPLYVLDLVDSNGQLYHRSPAVMKYVQERAGRLLHQDGANSVWVVD